MLWIYASLNLILMCMLPYATKKLFSIRTDNYQQDLYIKNVNTSITLGIVVHLIGTVVILFLSEKFALTPLVVIYHSLFLMGVSIATATDLHAKLIPHKLTHPLIIIGLTASAIYQFGIRQQDFSHFSLYILLPCVGVWLFFLGFNLVTGGQGIGHGDVFLFAALATIKGVFIVPIVALALVIAVLIMPFQRMMTKMKTFPLAPYIALSYIAWIAFEYTYFLQFDII